MAWIFMAKNTADLIKKVKRDRGDPLDPFTILLSGGDHRRIDQDDGRQPKSMPLY